jgi:hypothetical protein
MSRKDGRQTRSRRGWPTRLCGASLFLVVVLSVTGAKPASAASNGRWSVFPTTLPGQAARAYLHPVLTPGKAYSDAVTVSNFTSTPLTFNLYSADAVNTPGGGLSLRRRIDPQQDIGRWVELPYSQLTVPALTASVVPFTILPPAQASPGDHVGGIVAEETQGVTSASGSVPITVVQAVGVRIYARIVGPLHPQIDIPHLSLRVASSVTSQLDARVTARVRFTVRNAGNTVLSPGARVVLTTPFGTADRRTLLIDQLLPGSSLHYSLRFLGVNTFGHLNAEVTLSTPQVRAVASESVWTVPWALVALILLVLTLLVGTLIRLRRRRQRKATTSLVEGTATVTS